MFLRITPSETTTDHFFNTDHIAEVEVNDDKLRIKLSTGDEYTFDRNQVPEPKLNKFMSDLINK